MFSSGHIHIKGTSENPYHENYLKSKFQANISLYNQNFELHEQ